MSLSESERNMLAQAKRPMGARFLGGASGDRVEAALKKAGYDVTYGDDDRGQGRIFAVKPRKR